MRIPRRVSELPLSYLRNVSVKNCGLDSPRLEGWLSWPWSQIRDLIDAILDVREHQFPLLCSQ